ncbi:hypothetical protein CABS01_09844 [Colletotrichum abscissum]|uniref:uncharacterized protein n=1 Tax=Colletotrichum abscissum TaxID=1671311 RepID=UPI0027D534F9|nr:uncharacterized protein CABS01_09844 [Colletotrichum abscissum]KAK1501109.1 hypothetical protein CABS01_09844 [Colletotrichum abscissum]
MNDTEHMPMFHIHHSTSQYTPEMPVMLFSTTSKRLKHLTDSSIQEASSPTPSPQSSIHHRPPRDLGVFLPPADLASRLTPLPERSRQNAPTATTQLPAGLSGPTPRHTDGQVLSPLLQALTPQIFPQIPHTRTHTISHPHLR